jgi:hypothetical protein
MFDVGSWIAAMTETAKPSSRADAYANSPMVKHHCGYGQPSCSLQAVLGPNCAMKRPVKNTEGMAQV